MFNRWNGLVLMVVDSIFGRPTRFPSVIATTFQRWWLINHREARICHITLRMCMKLALTIHLSLFKCNQMGFRSILPITYWMLRNLRYIGNLVSLLKRLSKWNWLQLESNIYLFVRTNFNNVSGIVLVFLQSKMFILRILQIITINKTHLSDKMLNTKIKLLQ